MTAERRITRALSTHPGTVPIFGQRREASAQKWDCPPFFTGLLLAPLNDQTHEQLYIPAGFAHGFCVLSDTARVMYKCTDYYAPGEEYTLLWNDPAIGIAWPLQNPILADKDAQGKPLRDAFIPG